MGGGGGGGGGEGQSVSLPVFFNWPLQTKSWLLSCFLLELFILYHFSPGT